MPASTTRHLGGAPAPTCLRLLLPLLLATCAPSALALGVGAPQLLSGYAEPLRVRVPVILDLAEERSAADEVRAELVPGADYARYGVAEQAIDLGAIYTTSRSSGSATWIEIGSTRPMREPAAILLLRVRLGSTTIVREVPLMFEPATPQAESASAAPAFEAATAAPAAPAVSVAQASAVARPPRPHLRRPPPSRHIPAPPAQIAAASPAAAAAPSNHDPKYSSASAGLHLTESFDSLARLQLGRK
jgi:pilus assembly protein FimV